MSCRPPRVPRHRACADHHCRSHDDSWDDHGDDRSGDDDRAADYDRTGTGTGSGSGRRAGSDDRAGHDDGAGDHDGTDHDDDADHDDDPDHDDGSRAGSDDQRVRRASHLGAAQLRSRRRRQEDGRRTRCSCSKTGFLCRRTS
jgi:hypothetical protein